MNSAVDLRQLAVERSYKPDMAPRRGAWLTRWVLPLAIILAFGAIVLWTAREQWLPAKPVTITAVVMTKAEIREAGATLFQAAGWIEPRPTAVVCSALVEGVVDHDVVAPFAEVDANDTHVRAPSYAPSTASAARSPPPCSR